MVENGLTRCMCSADQVNPNHQNIMNHPIRSKQQHDHDHRQCNIKTQVCHLQGISFWISQFVINDFSELYNGHPHVVELLAILFFNRIIPESA